MGDRRNDDPGDDQKDDPGEKGVECGKPFAGSIDARINWSHTDWNHGCVQNRIQPGQANQRMIAKDADSQRNKQRQSGHQRTSEQPENELTAR